MQGGHPCPAVFIFEFFSDVAGSAAALGAVFVDIVTENLRVFLNIPDIFVSTDVVGAKLRHEVDRFVEMANSLKIREWAFPCLIFKQVEF